MNSWSAANAAAFEETAAIAASDDAALQAGADPLEPAATDREWLVPVAVIVAIEMLLWFAAYERGLSYAPLFKTYGLLAVTFFAVVIGARLVGITIRLHREGEAQPLLRIGQLAFANRVRILSAIVGLQLLAFGSAAFAALKAGIPKLVPFWIDLPVANAEQAVFGMAPWQWTHLYFDWATPFVDRVYATFLPIHLLTVFALLASPPSRLKSRALVTLSLCWIVLGIVAAYLLSSAGPLFYDRIFGGDRFAALTESVQAQAPLAQIAVDALWGAYRNGHAAIANGISAMPSMHVALTLWLALILNRTRAAPVGWIYFGLIWFGSVHLGWHYLSDGIVGAAGTLLLWKCSGTLLKWPALFRYLGRANGQSDDSSRTSFGDGFRLQDPLSGS